MSRGWFELVWPSMKDKSKVIFFQHFFSQHFFFSTTKTNKQRNPSVVLKRMRELGLEMESEEQAQAQQSATNWEINSAATNANFESILGGGDLDRLSIPPS